MRSMFFRTSVAIFLFVFCAAAMSLSVTRASGATATPIRTGFATAARTGGPTSTPFYPTFTPAPFTWNMAQIPDGVDQGRLIPGTLDANGKIVVDQNVLKALTDAWNLARENWYYSYNPSFNSRYTALGVVGAPFPRPYPDVPFISKLQGGKHNISIVACTSATYCVIADTMSSGERVAIEVATGKIVDTVEKPATPHYVIYADMLWDGTTWKVVWGSTTTKNLSSQMSDIVTPIRPADAPGASMGSPTPTQFYPTFTPAPFTWNMVQITDGPSKGKLIPGSIINGKIVVDKKVVDALADAWGLARRDWYYASDSNFNPEYTTMGAFGMPLPPLLPDTPFYSKLRGGMHDVGIVACESATQCTVVDFWYGGERVLIHTESGAVLKTDPKPYDRAHYLITAVMLWDGTTWKVVWNSTTSKDLLAK